MKKILLLFLGIILLSGCQKEEKLEYTYSYYKGFYFDFTVVEKMNNKQSVENVLGKINNLPEDLVNKLNTYNDEYFQNQDLIFIYFPMGSGTPTSSIDTLNINDNIELTISIKNSGYGTDDMSGHLYIIEIEKSYKDLIVFSKTNDEQPKVLKNSCEFSKTYKVEKVVYRDHDSQCHYVTLSSFENEDEYEILFCDTDYITFEEDKMYKFTFTPFQIPSIENSIKNMMRGNFLKVKIEQTDEIINENICNIDKRYFIETNKSYTCDSNSAIKQYGKIGKYNIYTYCTDEIYVIKENDRISLNDYLKNNKNFIDEIISKMNFEDIYNNGTTMVYRGEYPLFNNGLTLIKCSNNKIYLSDWYVSFTKEPVNFCG